MRKVLVHAQVAQDRMESELADASERVTQLEGELGAVKEYARDAAAELQSEAVARERGVALNTSVKALMLFAAC
jgi:hypothetical protein